MRRLILAGTLVRRVIIVIFGILLIPQAIELFSVEDNSKAELKALEQDGPVSVYETNALMHIDRDVFTVNAVYITPKQIVLHYTLHKAEPGGWSFPHSAVKVIGPNGEEPFQHSAGSNGKPWGTEGTLHFDAIKGSYNSLKVKYDLYDRQATVNIPLTQEGEHQ
ncbi:hypothetical protein KZ483_05665 [Paenibacillus sp. sptzw28]|uniref:hypothetical protein n=1 Tax=Paenibacillus sp. sptzw28 TaxID=715179 RepID=UPI001C6DE774|nr:hypothetical protein [Paenibacillus sp. sptzw28]QYR22463.1 hypothetical protein KZ483_05665 [Paenibacillus sp. sptzw28]